MDTLWVDAEEASRNGKKYMSCVEDRLLDVGKRIEDMDKYGIALTILSMTSPGIQGTIEPDVAISSAKATNEAIHGTFVEPHPDRFALFASVPLQNPEAPPTSSNERWWSYEPKGHSSTATPTPVATR
jgi:2,3-dihydroxybenzoate decarboxylase